MNGCRLLTGCGLALLIVAFAGPAEAQPTFAVWVDTATQEPSRFLWVPLGSPFDIVVTMDSGDLEVRAVEFGITDLKASYPTMIVTNVEPSAAGELDCALDGCVLESGAIAYTVGTCIPAGDRVEVARISYFDLTGAMLPYQKLSVFAMGTDEAAPPRFPESPGVVDCEETLHAATMGGSPELSLETCVPGFVLEPGQAALDVLCVAAGESSFGTLKARY